MPHPQKVLAQSNRLFSSLLRVPAMVLHGYGLDTASSCNEDGLLVQVNPVELNIHELKYRYSTKMTHLLNIFLMPDSVRLKADG